MSQELDEARTAGDEVQPEALPEPPSEDEILDSDASADATARPPETTPAPALAAAQITERLSEVERTITQRLANQERQLSRVEGRFDKSDGAGALVRQTRQEVADLRAAVEQVGELRHAMARLERLDELAESASRLDELDDLRDAIQLVLKRTLDPEEYATVDRTFAERRTSRATKRADEKATREKRLLEERATRAEKALAQKLSTVELPPATQRPAPVAPPPAPEYDPETARATATLLRAIQKADYQPDDPAFQRRLLTAAGDLSKVGSQSERLTIMMDALLEIQAEDRRTEREMAKRAAEESTRKTTERAEADRRTAARTQVQPDRTRAATGTRSYRTLTELEAAVANDEETDFALVRRLRAELPR